MNLIETIIILFYKQHYKLGCKVQKQNMGWYDILLQHKGNVVSFFAINTNQHIGCFFNALKQKGDEICYNIGVKHG